MEIAPTHPLPIVYLAENGVRGEDKIAWRGRLRETPDELLQARPVQFEVCWRRAEFQLIDLRHGGRSARPWDGETEGGEAKDVASHPGLGGLDRPQPHDAEIGITQVANHLGRRHAAPDWTHAGPELSQPGDDFADAGGISQGLQGSPVN